MAKYNNVVLYCTDWGDKDELFASMRSLTQTNPEIGVLVVSTVTKPIGLELPIPCDLLVPDNVPAQIISNPKLLRIFAFDMLNGIAGKVLYMDTDTIIMQDLSNLFECSGAISATYHGDTFCDAVMVVDIPRMYSTINGGSLWNMYMESCKKEYYHCDDELFLNEIFTATKIADKYNTRAKDHKRLIPSTIAILHYAHTKPWSDYAAEQYSYRSMDTILGFFDKDSEKYKKSLANLNKLKILFDLFESINQSK